METLAVGLIVICVGVIVATYILMNHSMNVCTFDLHVLDAFAGALNEIDTNDPCFDKLMDDYDAHYECFKNIYDSKGHGRWIPFRKLKVSTIYGDYVAEYLQPYIDEKIL